MSVIRTAVNSYYDKVNGLTGDKMYDPEIQRDLARECVLEVDGVLTSWRNWRGAKRGP